jgi:hypothetical protein
MRQVANGRRADEGSREPATGGTPVPLAHETYVDTARAWFHYARAGSGPPVLLLPGGGGWKVIFQAMIGVLAQHHTIYALAPFLAADHA